METVRLDSIKKSHDRVSCPPTTMSKKAKGKGKSRQVNSDSEYEAEASDENEAKPQTSSNARNPSGKNQYGPTRQLLDHFSRPSN